MSDRSWLVTTLLVVVASMAWLIAVNQEHRSLVARYEALEQEHHELRRMALGAADSLVHAGDTIVRCEQQRLACKQLLGMCQARIDEIGIGPRL